MDCTAELASFWRMCFNSIDGGSTCDVRLGFFTVFGLFTELLILLYVFPQGDSGGAYLGQNDKQVGVHVRSKCKPNAIMVGIKIEITYTWIHSMIERFLNKP